LLRPASTEWIELRNESKPRHGKVEGHDRPSFFSDSDVPIREQEIRRFLPQINPYGLILDARCQLLT